MVFFFVIEMGVSYKVNILVCLSINCGTSLSLAKSSMIGKSILRRVQFLIRFKGTVSPD